MEETQFAVVPGVNSLSDIDYELAKVISHTVPVIDRLRGLAGSNPLARRVLMALTNTVGNLLGAAAYLHDHPEDEGHRFLFHSMRDQALRIISRARTNLLGGHEQKPGA
ncbi:MAG: hypothetical protein H0X24_01790 [Ktedonobacterales bacterium]|nr:hypothetical protein [Ktedonobacterales bacterium]